MPVDDKSDVANENRILKKTLERMQVHATSGLQARYITRTDYDALVLAGLALDNTLYGVDEAL